MLTCSTKDLSQIYGCSVQYIGELVKSGILPHPVKQNCHDVIKACRAIIEKIREDASEQKTGIDAENLRLVKARARKAELEVLELTKILIPAKDVKDAAFEKARTLRDQFINIPARISPIVAAEHDAKKVYEMMDKEIRQVLEALSGDLNESKN